MTLPSGTLKRQKLKQKQAIHIVLRLVVCMVCDGRFTTTINLFQDSDCQHDPSQGITGVGDYMGPFCDALACASASFFLSSRCFCFIARSSYNNMLDSDHHPSPS